MRFVIGIALLGMVIMAAASCGEGAKDKADAKSESIIFTARLFGGLPESEQIEKEVTRGNGDSTLTEKRLARLVTEARDSPCVRVTPDAVEMYFRDAVESEIDKAGEVFPGVGDDARKGMKLVPEC